MNGYIWYSAQFRKTGSSSCFLIKYSTVALVKLLYKSITQLFNTGSVQFSCIQLFLTPLTAACQASLSITKPQSLLKPMSIKSVMPSNHLIPSRPLFLPSIFPSIRIFSKKSVLRISWPKYWSFSFSISPFNEYSGLISFRIWSFRFDLLAVQRTIENLLQHHSSKASILQLN